MKKIVMASAIVFAALTASAQTVGVATYDGAGVSHTGASQQEIGLGLKRGIGQGFAVEGLVTGNFARGGNTGVTSNGEGLEAAVSKTFAPVGSWTTSLRLGAGRKLYENSDVNYYSVDASAATPISAKTDLVLGYRFRNGFKDSDTFRSNRGTIGVAYKLNKTVTLGAAYAHTAGEGYISNGVIASVAYAF